MTEEDIIEAMAKTILTASASGSWRDTACAAYKVAKPTIEQRVRKECAGAMRTIAILANATADEMMKERP